MKLITNDLNIARGFELLKSYVDLSANLDIYASPEKTEGYSVHKAEDGSIRILYSTVNTFYMALKEVLIGEYETENVCSVTRRGLLIDCARNAVISLQTAKKYVAFMALLGYNYLELYVEDCLKIDGDEQFGYMRGAYSKDEIKALDEFAQLFGVELVPCIQTLAHYNQLLRRPEYACVMDQGDALLIGEEKTYELLDKLLKTVSEAFTSRRINIGIDEAWNAGRGKYYDKHGAYVRHEIIMEHLKKVLTLCEKYSFQPAMWSDMIFREVFNGAYFVSEGEFTQEHIDSVPKGVDLLYWDYYHIKEEQYDYMLKLHEQLNNKFCFVGAIWTWRGYAPYNEYTEYTMFPALEACRKHNVNDIMFAVWGDNGGECARFATLSSLVVLMEKMLHGEVDFTRVSKILVYLTGYSYEELKKLDLANHVFGEKLRMNVNPSKYLLFGDPFVSFFDEYVQKGCEKIYEKSYQELSALAKRKSEFAYLFDTQAKLCKVMAEKAELSVHLKEAYDKRDMAALKALTKSLSSIIKNATAFYEAVKTQWDLENKPFGFEVQDIRLGGLIMRLKHVQARLKAFISGKCSVIEELEETRHSYTLPKHWGDSTMFNDYSLTVTAGIL